MTREQVGIALLLVPVVILVVCIAHFLYEKEGLKHLLMFLAAVAYVITVSILLRPR